MRLDWIDFISLFTFIQLLFLTVVILNYKKGKRLSNLLLAGFMASNALLFAPSLFARFGWTSSEYWIIFYAIGSSMYLLLTPFLFLYIQSLCYKNFHLKTMHLLHILPFGIFVLFSLLIYALNHAALHNEMYLPLKQNTGAVEYWSHKIVLHVQVLSYLVASIVVLIGYRNRLKDLYSSIEKIDLAWCNLLLTGFAAMWFLDLLNWILSSSHVFSPAASGRMLFSSIFINFVFTLTVTYKGLAQSASFSGIQGQPKYAASRLQPSDCESIIRKLTTLIENEKPYLSPSLSVEDLSKKLRTPVKNLSQALHTGLNQNFYDFINAYRIEEIKRRIQNDEYKNYTLLAIALDAGFNSKSVFNAAFKKHTGVTPKEYRYRHAS